MAKLSLNVKNTGKGVKVLIPGLGEFENGQIHEVEKLEEDLVVGMPLEESSEETKSKKTKTETEKKEEPVNGN